MNIPVLLGLTWTQATPPKNWQRITNDIHKGQHKPNFPSNSWLNESTCGADASVLRGLMRACAFISSGRGD